MTFTAAIQLTSQEIDSILFIATSHVAPINLTVIEGESETGADTV